MLAHAGGVLSLGRCSLVVFWPAGMFEDTSSVIHRQVDWVERLRGDCQDYGTPATLTSLPFLRTRPTVQLKVRFIEHGPEILMCWTVIYGTYTSHVKGFAQLHKDHRD